MEKNVVESANNLNKRNNSSGSLTVIYFIHFLHLSLIDLIQNRVTIMSPECRYRPHKSVACINHETLTLFHGDILI